MLFLADPFLPVYTADANTHHYLQNYVWFVFFASRYWAISWSPWLFFLKFLFHAMNQIKPGLQAYHKVYVQMEWITIWMMASILYIPSLLLNMYDFM